MPSSKVIKKLFKLIIIICIILFLFSAISILINNPDQSSNDETNFNFTSHEKLEDTSAENSSDIELDNGSNSESIEKHKGVDDSPYTLAKNDPDWYYDHYDYGDYDDIDEYLESQGY